MTKAPAHKWTFSTKLRSRAFGWSGSALACQRIKEAISEIQGVACLDPFLAAEGAIQLMGRLWPALQQVDSSSGALGSAANRAVEAAVALISAAPADSKTRSKWLDRLWEIHEEDGVGYVQGLTDQWGELCASPEVAGQWADRFVPIVREHWENNEPGFRYFNGTNAALSCLIAAGRYQELLDLLERAPYVTWGFRQYGVRALVVMGRPDDAIAYALAPRGLNDNPVAIDRCCEAILLKEGRAEEAYTRFALTANFATTNIATFRALKKKYPGREPQSILRDLIARSPGEEGKWFATAKEMGLYDLALELVRNSPAEPKTLNRAARDFAVKNPPFALGAALASLHWIVEGYGYELTGADVSEAYQATLQIAEKLGAKESVEKEIQTLLQTENQWVGFARQALGMKAKRG